MPSIHESHVIITIMTAAFIHIPIAKHHDCTRTTTPPPTAAKLCTRRTILTIAALALPTKIVRARELLEYEKLDSGLVVQDLRIGSGVTPTRTSTIKVRWTGRLIARYGWPFQNEPAETVYNLSKDLLIPGFIEGVTTMNAGGKRRLIIPSSLGYNQHTTSFGPLPSDFGNRRRLLSTVANPRRSDANSGAVVIDVELLKVIAK